MRNESNLKFVGAFVILFSIVRIYRRWITARIVTIIKIHVILALMQMLLVCCVLAMYTVKRLVV